MTDSIGSVKLDDDFLKECGLAELQVNEGKLLLEMFYREMETRVGTALSSGLSDDQLSEFESFVDGDMQMIRHWLNTEFPRFEEERTYSQIKAKLGSDASEDVLLQETASLLWLGKNRPGYKQTVEQVFESMRAELIRHREVLLK